jgi:hypothetical protein
MGTTPNGEPPARGWPVGAAIGLLSGAVAVGAGTPVAGLVGTGTSPVLAVGAAAVDASPEGLKRFAIDTFGTDDKTALLLGIGIVLAIAAVVLGIVSLRRPRAGVIGLVVLGTIGALAAVTRPTNGLLAAVPSIVGAASGLWAFVWLRGRAGLPPVPRAADPARQRAPYSGRRWHCPAAASSAGQGEGRRPGTPCPATGRGSARRLPPS